METQSQTFGGVSQALNFNYIQVSFQNTCKAPGPSTQVQWPSQTLVSDGSFGENNDDFILQRLIIIWS